ncbi:hypothetical protein KP509_21G086000 [Ceratopteris richardii]|nr:hypothetical protein KP509_21G086000 [Ceratopteris richardii]
MALAISHFEALCGFMSPQEIKEVMIEYPELHPLLGDSEVKALLDMSWSKDLAKVALRAAFTRLMSADDNVVNDTVCKIVARLSKKDQMTAKEQLVIRLADQYPGDIGVLSSLFLNYISLNPGEALYLDANEPHAYIAGECVECMATSDNVIRAGLTPKYKDTQTLCSMLSYRQGQPNILSGVMINPQTRRYSPPFEEFELDVSILKHGESMVFPALLGPSVVLVLKGKGMMHQRHGKECLAITLMKGDVYFIPAGVVLILHSSLSSKKLDHPLHLYRAGISSAFLLTNAATHDFH